MTSDTVHDVTEHADGEHGAHPTDAMYVKIALILAALTGVEIGLFYKELGAFNNLALIGLAAIKFVLVASYFMHLKFDNHVLRRFFIGGFVLAVFCYVAFLSTLGVFGGS